MRVVFRACYLLSSLIFSQLSLAENPHNAHIVHHVDPINIDANLSLNQLVLATVDKYPDSALLPALQKQTEALVKRGNSWFAGSLTARIDYLDDTLAKDEGSREIEGAFEFPLWNWGQRDAGQKLGEQSQKIRDLQENVIQLRVAGLLRASLWEMRFTHAQYSIARQMFEVSEKLTKTVKRRVDLGDLPKTDFLLAQSDLLEKRSLLITTEAETMHARKRFSTLTQSTTIPKNFTETQSTLTEINDEHPALKLINAMTKHKQAELNWVKAQGSGQTTVAIGGKSERESRQNDDSNSILVSLAVPFGGAAHLAPEIADTHLEITETLIEQRHLYRQLLENLHEAEHALEVDRAELTVATQAKKIAETHLKMTQLSFNAGEINLMDLLKIQSRSYRAIQHAEEHAIILQRDIAFYNQAVGVLP